MDKNKHITDKQKKYVELCSDGKTRKEIMDILGVSTKTITSYKKSLGVSPKPYKDMDGILQKYVDLCRGGYNRKEIAEAMNVSIDSVSYYARKTGVHLIPSRKPNINQDYFECIDSEEKAYILGFLSADGYLDRDCKSISLAINQKDIEILQRMKIEMNCGNAIRKTHTPNCVRLNMCSKKMVSDLMKYGICRNKSKYLTFPSIDNELYRHYFRGYCDGNGCVSKRQVAIVIGSNSFFNSAVLFLEKEFGRKISARDLGTHYYIVLSRKDLDIIEWMYDNPKIVLSRKYRSYIENWVSYAEKRRTTG